MNESYRRLLASVWQESHKASPLDRQGYSVLAHCRATRLATTYDSAMAIDQLAKQVDVFVVDIHWPWTFSFYEQRILLLGTGANSRTFARTFALARITASWRCRSAHIVCPKLQIMDVLSMYLRYWVSIFARLTDRFPELGAEPESENL